MSKIRKRRETSADITIFRKSDNSRLVGINVIKTQPDVNHHICRIPRQDSIGVREEVTTTEISSGGRIGKHQVKILNCLIRNLSNHSPISPPPSTKCSGVRWTPACLSPPPRSPPPTSRGQARGRSPGRPLPTPSRWSRLALATRPHRV